MYLQLNDVEGNIRASSNTGGVTVLDNSASGNLECSSNDPVPTGSGNIIGGNMLSQCSGF